MVEFEPHLKIVNAIYNKYFKKYYWLKEDLIQEGNIALLRACEKFDSSKETKFITFASTCIKNAMMIYIKKETRISKPICDIDILEFDNSFIYEEFGTIALIDKIKSINDEVCKKIIYLMMGGLKNKEICEVLNKSYRQVHKKIEYIKEFLLDKVI